jgi:energy-coupling factor transporter ATP-binding protein EcfA2
MWSIRVSRQLAVSGRMDLVDPPRPESIGLVEDHRLVSEGRTFAELAEFQAACRDLGDTFYIGPFRNALNLGAGAYFDIQAGDAFVRYWDDAQSGVSRSRAEMIFRLQDDIKKIFRLETLQITASPDKRTLRLIVDGRSYELREQGSGLTQFVLVLGSLAERKPAYVLIDEPELNLHPTLQIDFLTTLGAYATQGVVFATHVIGLARATADRVYSVRKVNRSDSAAEPFEAVPHLAEFLGEMGYTAYHQLGFTKVLLVEGPTELKAVQQLLRIYGRDHEVLLLPLGGGELINAGTEVELSEMKRIAADTFALIDSERLAPEEPLSSERQAFVELCKKLDIDCHVLEKRAFENYFTAAALQRAKGAGHTELGAHQALKDASRPWAKRDNWRIAREMTRDELESTDLGKFLASF